MADIFKSVHVDVTGLDEAIKKAKKLKRLLRQASALIDDLKPGIPDLAYAPNRSTPDIGCNPLKAGKELT